MSKLVGVLALFGFSMIAFAPTADAQDTVQLVASLNGANEVGEPGDPDGSGTATITVDAVNTQICFDITAAGIDPVTAGHIHSGGAGSNGDVVVDFNLDASLTAGCVNSDTAMIASILNTPELFYVNLHNEAFPAGAIRGQLAAPAPPAPEATPEAATISEAAPAADSSETLAFTGDFTGALGIVGAALVVGGSTMVVASRRQD